LSLDGHVGGWRRGRPQRIYATAHAKQPHGQKKSPVHRERRGSVQFSSHTLGVATLRAGGFLACCARSLAPALGLPPVDATACREFATGKKKRRRVYPGVWQAAISVGSNQVGVVRIDTHTGATDVCYPAEGGGRASACPNRRKSRSPKALRRSIKPRGSQQQKSPAGEGGAMARSVVRLERIHVGSIYDRLRQRRA